MGELESLFRNWLGHDVRVSGEMTRDGQTLTLTLRAGADPVDPVTGPTSDPGALIKKAAEELYGATQPERYARWLRGANRNDDAANIYRRLSITGTPRQRARALVGWSGVLGDNPAGSIQKAQEALRLDPENPSAWASLSDNQMELGLWEATLKSARRAVQLFAGPGGPTSRPGTCICTPPTSKGTSPTCWTRSWSRPRSPKPPAIRRRTSRS